MPPSICIATVCVRDSRDDRPAGAEYPERGERVQAFVFSAQPFPGYQVEVERVSEELGGAWYRWSQHNRNGWLCPALLNYFPTPPAKLYCRAESLPPQ